MANSPDIWNAVNGLNQQGYEAALGGHQTQPGGYGNLEAAHDHMVRLRTFPSFRGAPVTRGQHSLSRVTVCRTRTPPTRCWLLTSAGGSRRCPPSIAATWHRAPLRTPPVIKINTVIFFLAVFCGQYFMLRAVCLFQSRGATEMRPEGHRQATPWAKLWPR